MEALQEAMNIFQAFDKRSWLKLIPLKSEIYTSGVWSSQLQQMVEMGGYEIGNSPARYLGLCLISGKLSDRDRNVLTDRILSRIPRYSAKRLFCRYIAIHQFCNLQQSPIGAGCSSYPRKLSRTLISAVIILSDLVLMKKQGAVKVKLEMSVC